MEKYKQTRSQQIVTWKITPQQYVAEIKKQGYIAFYSTCTTPTEGELPTYTLVVKRKEKRPKGFYREYIPIDSINGDRIIHKFLYEGSVMIFPEYFLKRKLFKNDK
jgi:hypothetical protein